METTFDAQVSTEPTATQQETEQPITLESLAAQVDDVLTENRRLQENVGVLTVQKDQLALYSDNLKSELKKKRTKSYLLGALGGALLMFGGLATAAAVTQEDEDEDDDILEYEELIIED